MQFGQAPDELLDRPQRPGQIIEVDYERRIKHTRPATRKDPSFTWREKLRARSPNDLALPRIYSTNGWYYQALRTASSETRCWLLWLSSSILPPHCASRHSRGFRNRSASRPPVLLSSSCLSECASWNDSARQQSNRPNRSWRALSPHRQYLWKSGYHSDRVFAAVYAIPCARHLSNE